MGGVMFKSTNVCHPSKVVPVDEAKYIPNENASSVVAAPVLTSGVLHLVHSVSAEHVASVFYEESTISACANDLK